jgi:methionyl-tRNA formyltransferase
MPTSGISLVFLGSGPVAEASLRALTPHFRIEAVITKPTTLEQMASIAQPVYTASDRRELDALIARKQFKSRLGIIVDYGVIVSQQVIDAFPLGIINSHFSLLPRWRGADPISFAILEGDTKTGVSLMLIEPSLDTGDILVQKSLPIAPDDTTPKLTKKLIELSNQLLAEYLPRYVSGEIKPRSQPHPDRATHSRKLTKDDGIIDWTKPAEQIEREIRAFIEWPKSRTELAGKDVIVTEAKALPVKLDDKKPGYIDSAGKQLVVACKQGALLIERLKPAGKNEMTAAEFIRGYLR